MKKVNNLLRIWKMIGLTRYDLLKKHRVQEAFNSRLWRDPGQEKVREDHPLLQFRLISTMRSLECKKFISLFN